MNFFSVIPAPVLRCKVLIPNAKLLYGYISASLNVDGFCTLTNDELGELFGVKAGSISTWIAQLKNLGYISFEMEYQKSSGDISKRKIYLNLSKVVTPPTVFPVPPPNGKTLPRPTVFPVPPPLKVNKIKGSEFTKTKKEKNDGLLLRSNNNITNNSIVSRIKDYTSIFQIKREKFFKKNKNENPLPFFWDTKEIVQLKNIRKRLILLLKKSGKYEMDEDRILQNFDSFMERFLNLENSWMPENGFAPSWIISNWNLIINQMSKNGKSTNRKTSLGEKGRNNQFTQDDAERTLEKLREKGIM